MISQNYKPITDPLRFGVTRLRGNTCNVRFEIREPLFNDFKLMVGDNIKVTYLPVQHHFIIEKDPLARATLNKKFGKKNVYGFTHVVKVCGLKTRVMFRANYVIEDNKLLVSI
jgi:hypothetical protein